MDRSKTTLGASAASLYFHFALQLAAGAALATHYRPTVAHAHADTTALHQGAWGVLQGFHYWGSAVLIVHAALHLAAVTWSGWYRTQPKGYFAALFAFGVAFGFQLTGNALSWDRHGVQTAAIEGSIAARVPGAGPAVSKAMLGGEGVSEATLALWYRAHEIALPAALAIGLVLAILAMRSDKLKLNKATLVIPAGVALALALGLASPLGSAATPDDYDRFDAKVSWYTWPMHGLLDWGDKLIPGGGWVGSVVLPTLFGLAFLALLLWKPKPPVARGVLVFIAALCGGAAFTSGTRFAPLVGTRDPKTITKVAEKPKEKADAKLQAKGVSLFEDQGCSGCHGKDGQKGTGGPRLRNVWQEHSDADFYVRYIKNPKSVKSTSTMPAYPDLKADELQAIAEYLRFPRS